MTGKILKIANNDLYGNVDDRKVALFAVFTHKKYMNKYAIFTFSEEYNKNKLYCGSIHLKENSIVTFSVRDEELVFINKFINDFMNNQIDANEFEIIDVSNITKIELVSNNALDFDRLVELDNLTIPKVETKEEVQSNGKPVFLYFLLVISILSLIGIIYLHHNPDILNVKLNKLTCTMNGNNQKIMLPYTSEATIMFDRNNELKSISKVDTYTFSDNDSYLNFKDNGKENTSFKIEGSYKYDDDNLTLKIIYDDKLIIYAYEDVLRYMKKEGYSCIEDVYYE